MVLASGEMYHSNEAWISGTENKNLVLLLGLMLEAHGISAGLSLGRTVRELVEVEDNYHEICNGHDYISHVGYIYLGLVWVPSNSGDLDKADETYDKDEYCLIYIFCGVNGIVFVDPGVSVDLDESLADINTKVEEVFLISEIKGGFISSITKILVCSVTNKGKYMGVRKIGFRGIDHEEIIYMDLQVDPIVTAMIMRGHVEMLCGNVEGNVFFDRRFLNKRIFVKRTGHNDLVEVEKWPAS
ncbi:hypothetical protein C1645_881272 [Glomus cerebriforme]|uniref:Uncharacterized protein n=1 Tax=Glomus cerebriforme TaxID=658196 RepID=A0A397S7V6_9GLOM|nr:hypothetical protein C1645_881272 [Glomus cerebriforme]